MPYLEITKNEAHEIKNTLNMPSLVGLSKDDAKEILKAQGLEFEFNESDILSETPKIVKQVPEEGVKIEEGSKIILYVK